MIVRARYLPELSAKVVDEKGMPIRRFNVGSHDYSGGAFSTRSWDATQPLEIAAEGYATEFISVPAPGPFADVKLPPVTLTKGELIRGRVIDARTKQPIAGATVARAGSVHRLKEGHSTGCGTCYEAWAKRQLPESVTDSDGRFEIRLTSARREVTVMSHGYRPLTAQLSAGENALALDQGAIIEGRAFDQSGQPMADAHVSVTPGPRWVQSDADGKFEVSGLEAGSFIVRVLSAHFAASQRVDVSVGKTTKVELRPRPGFAVHVSIAPLPRFLSICEGDCDEPSSNADLKGLFEQSSLTDVFSPLQFSGRALGRHTVMSWTVSGDDLLLERQAITLPLSRSFVDWKPDAKRSYSEVSVEFVKLLPEAFKE